MQDHHRNTGFLRPKERALLHQHGCYPVPVDEEPPKGVAQTKSRLKNQVAKASTLREAIEAFENDLFAIDLYQRKAAEQEQILWKNVMLEQIHPELTQLRDFLDELIDRAEDASVWSERAELQEALAELYGGPEPLKWVGLGSGASGEENPPPPDELEREFLEMQDRQEALDAVLRREGWPDILEHLKNHGKSRLPDEQARGDEGEPWNRVASREFTKRELVEKEQLSNRNMMFELTPRGEAVANAWVALKKTRPVQTMSETHPDHTPRESTLELLVKHFSANFGN